MATCILGICDGSGFLYDEETNTARDCACRPQIIARNKARSLSAVIPERYRDVAFERFPVTEIDPKIVAATRRFVDRIDAQPRRRPRPLVHGAGRHRQDDAGDARHQGGARRGPLGGALLAARPAEPDPQDLRHRLAQRPARAARPPSTCCTSTTSAPSRRRPGCSRSSTRSSTPATRSSGRS